MPAGAQKCQRERQTTRAARPRPQLAPPPGGSTSGAGRLFGARHHGAVRAGCRRELSALASRVAFRGFHHPGTHCALGCVCACRADPVRFPLVLRGPWTFAGWCGRSGCPRPRLFRRTLDGSVLCRGCTEGLDGSVRVGDAWGALRSRSLLRVPG